MKNLLFKEFKLSISSGFFFMALFGALIMIPSWLYFIALMYTMFIMMPNIFISAKAQNDIGFSVMLPVSKSDVVKARVVSVVIMQLLPIFAAAVFAVLNITLYKGSNFFMNPNVAFFGLVFIMYAIFNLVFFPWFYKSAYKVAAPSIWANAAAILFMAAVELANIFVPSIRAYIGGIENMAAQLPVLIGGILIYALSAFASFKISAKRFEKVDI